MSIRSIRVSNFKSFRSLPLELRNFNVLIGANAAGKSNFVQIFKFLRDITVHGLADAISLQGGTPYLRNIRIGASENLVAEIVYDHESRIRRKSVGVKFQQGTYKFALRFKKRGPGFEIAEDRLTHIGTFVRLERHQKQLVETDILGHATVTFSNANGRVQCDLDPPTGLPLSKDDILPPMFKDERLPSKTLLIEHPFFFFHGLEAQSSDLDWSAGTTA